jgi:hypothetical protein
MNTRNTIVILLCVTLMSVAGNESIAQTKQKPSVVVRVRVRTIEGQVRAINLQTSALTILVNKTAEVVTCGPECKYGDDKDGLESLAELKIDEKIYVKCAEYEGRVTATRVARLKPQKAKVKPPTRSAP